MPPFAAGDTHVRVMFSLCIKLALAAGFGIIVLALL